MKRLVIAGVILASVLSVPACASGIELSKISHKAAGGTEVPAAVASPSARGLSHPCCSFTPSAATKATNARS